MTGRKHTLFKFTVGPAVEFRGYSRPTVKTIAATIAVFCEVLDLAPIPGPVLSFPS